MSYPEFIDLKPLYRVIHFGLPKNPLSNEQIRFLFDSVMYSVPFVCVRHNPWISPGIKIDYDQVHYHVLTRRSVRESCWSDEKWNALFEKVEVLKGWTKVELCYNVTEQMAFLQMSGMEMVINKMDPVFLKTWNNVDGDDIDNQTIKNQITSSTVSKLEKIDE